MTATHIPLRTLLCQVYEHQLKRESNFWQYAARLSLSEINFTEHGPELRSQLESLANGDMAVDDAKRHETLAAIVRGKLRGGAIDETLKQEARRLGRAVHKKNTWQVLVESIVSAAKQIKSSLPQGKDDWLVRSYCERALADRVDAYEHFDAAVEQLDQDNFTVSALEQLWDECKAECREIPLPEPAVGLAETIDDKTAGTQEVRHRSLPQPRLAPGKPTEGLSPLLNPSAPLTLKETADHIGGQITSKKLRLMMKAGIVAFRELSRQSFQFSRDDFPQLPER